MNVDPISGNEVPPGATPEEVRDDIPINASEGEYVLPANVVRFIGLDKIEKMVAKAREELAKMDMGGELPEEEMAPKDTVEGPAPEEAQGMAKGGMVSDGGSFSGSKEYRNASGNVMFIPFIDGQPLFDIPEGYSEAGGPSPTGRDNPSSMGSQGSIGASYRPQSLMDGEATNESRKVARDNASPLAGDPRDWTPKDFINYGAGVGGVGNKAIKGIISMIPGGMLAMRAQDKWKAPLIADGFDQMIETGIDLQGNPINESQMISLRETRDNLKADLSERSGLSLGPVESLGNVFKTVANFIAPGSFEPNKPVQVTKSSSGGSGGSAPLAEPGIAQALSGGTMSSDAVGRSGGSWAMGSELGRDPNSGPSVGSMSTGGLYKKGGLVTRRNKK